MKQHVKYVGTSRLFLQGYQWSDKERPQEAAPRRPSRNVGGEFPKTADRMPLGPSPPSQFSCGIMEAAPRLRNNSSQVRMILSSR
jgi:hypothetical protein